HCRCSGSSAPPVSSPRVDGRCGSEHRAARSARPVQPAPSGGEGERRRRVPRCDARAVAAARVPRPHTGADPGRRLRRRGRCPRVRAGAEPRGRSPDRCGEGADGGRAGIRRPRARRRRSAGAVLHVQRGTVPEPRRPDPRRGRDRGPLAARARLPRRRPSARGPRAGRPPGLRPRVPRAVTAVWRRVDDDGESGQITLLSIGFGLLALTLVLVVAAASSLYLERKQLLALADGAAADAADAIDYELYYGAAAAAEGLPLSTASVRGSVEEY